MTGAGARVGVRQGIPPNATRTTVGTLGVLAAWAGVEHGIGAIGQGWLAPPSWVFRSWEGTPAFAPLNGEPAMTVVPNLLVTGVLAAIVSLAVGVWAVRFADRKHGGVILIALSVLLLLVGGGFGPPLLGVVAGMLATRIGRVTSAPTRPAFRWLAAWWPWPLIATVVFFLSLVPGTALLYLAAGVDDPVLVSSLTAAAFASTALAVLSARSRDRIALPPE